MKFLRLGLCAAAFLSLSATAAHAQKFGIVAGGNWEALADIDASLSGAFQTSAGWHVGAFAEIGTPIVAVRPGLIYSNAGSLMAGLSAGTLSASSFRVSNLIVPVDVILKAIPVLYLFAGPEFQVNLSNGAPAALSDTFNKTNLRAGLGFGLDLVEGVATHVRNGGAPRAPSQSVPPPFLLHNKMVSALTSRDD